MTSLETCRSISANKPAPSILLDKYQWILFDADETLFTFESLLGLQRMFAKFAVEFSQDHYAEYNTKNKALWADFQNGIINAQQLKRDRFTVWSERTGHDAKLLNSAFLAEMLEISSLMDGASNILDSLKGKVKLGIITNGFVELQQARLVRNNLSDYFEILVISESVGAAKPHQKIFEHALQLMGNPDVAEVLMVGDSLESDILGGRNFGFDTCLVNAKKPVHLDIKPHYAVSDLHELINLLSTPLESKSAQEAH